MRDDGQALLKAIMANPDDDLPRWIYADWLDENNQSTRAEFIRLQIERYHQSRAALEPTGISFREYEILREYEHTWRAELPRGFRDGCAFRRGFIYRANCSVRWLFRLNQDNPILAPIENLTLTIDELSLEWMTQPLPAFELPLKELTVQCEVPVGPVLAEMLPRHGPYPWLKTLRIHDNLFGDEGLALLRPESLPTVRSLNLAGCGITDGGAIDLVTNGWLDQLEILDLPSNNISQACIDWLRSRLNGTLLPNTSEARDRWV